MQKLAGIDRIMLMHNGVMDYAGGDDYSDSMEFAQMVAAFNVDPFADAEHCELHDKMIDKLAGDGQRLLFMNPTQSVLYGKWEQDEGYYYSNSDYRWGRCWYGTGYGYSRGGWGSSSDDDNKFARTEETCEMCGYKGASVELSDNYSMDLCVKCNDYLDGYSEGNHISQAIKEKGINNAVTTQAEVDTPSDGCSHATCICHKCQQAYVQRVDEIKNNVLLCPECLKIDTEEGTGCDSYKCASCAHEFVRSKEDITKLGTMYCETCILDFYEKLDGDEKDKMKRTLAAVNERHGGKEGLDVLGEELNKAEEERAEEKEPIVCGTYPSEGKITLPF
jgi:hypothetical protein